MTQRTAELFGVPFDKKVAASTLPGQWIIGDVIDIMLAKYSRDNPMSNVIHFSSLAGPIILRDNPKSPDDSQLRNLFDKRYDSFGRPNINCLEAVLYPHHQNSHYTMVVVWVKERRVTYCDSWVGNKTKSSIQLICEIFLNYTIHQLNRFCPKDKKFERVAFPRTTPFHPFMPIQPNGFDCGFYVIKVAECIMKKENISFSQDVINDLRVEVHNMMESALNDVD